MNEEIKQELATLQKRLNEIELIVNVSQPARKKTVWDLKGWDECWIISDKPNKINFHIELSYFRDIGILFLTEEECQRAIDVMKARTIWIKTIAELNDGWEPDWRDIGKNKYFYQIEHINGDIILAMGRNQIFKLHDSCMYAKSKKILEKAREILGYEITRLAWIGE